MKKIILLSVLLSGMLFPQKSWIRINQIGYLEKSVKVAVLISKEKAQPKYFGIYDALTDEFVWKGAKIKSYGSYGGFTESYRIDFSEFQKAGAYYIIVGNVKSPNFRIANDIYEGTADFLLNYMRQQQCGYNPFLKDSCHTRDGFEVDDSGAAKQKIDVTGGWHNASDYVKYVSTSATAVFDLLFAYQQNPASFKDEYDKDGNKIPNGIPDILDQAKWGLDWLVKMNPSNGFLYLQVGDERSEKEIRLPDSDNKDYRNGAERSVYLCAGQPQGSAQYKNNTSGIASVAGKFASAFALGAQTLRNYYPGFIDLIKSKAIDAYEVGRKNPGVCQTIPNSSGYFQEEEDYADDMELAGIQLYNLTGEKKYLEDAVKFGNQEPVSGWMEKGFIKPYQFYPFINLGHYFLGREANKKTSGIFINNLKKGLEKIFEKAKNNPFLIGIPFEINSNNLVTSVITQSRLYYELTGDAQFQEMEAALRDWLLGCNPWGTSMIIGIPGAGIFPERPFSFIQRITKKRINGGLINGPVWASQFETHKNISLMPTAKYKGVQPNDIVLHDDVNDYVTNQPTLDGTAGLTYYFSLLQMEGEKHFVVKNYQYNEGGITRTDRSKKEIHLVFAGSEYADGGDIIRKVLKNQKVKAHFFFTGDFYRRAEFASVIYNLKSDGNYLGAHSDKNPHYIYPFNRDSILISKEEFKNDLHANYMEMEKFRIMKADAALFLPPFNAYNQRISDWCNEIGLQLVTNSYGTFSAADTTLPGTPEYKSSDEIYKQILDYEKDSADGLNGFILLSHIGSSHERKDKFYKKLDSLITELKKRGYTFTLIDYP